MLQNELENVLIERFLSKFSLSGEDERAVLEGAVLKSFKKDDLYERRMSGLRYLSMRAYARLCQHE